MHRTIFSLLLVLTYFTTETSSAALLKNAITNMFVNYHEKIFEIAEEVIKEDPVLYVFQPQLAKFKAIVLVNAKETSDKNIDKSLQLVRKLLAGLKIWWNSAGSHLLETQFNPKKLKDDTSQLLERIDEAIRIYGLGESAK